MAIPLTSFLFCVLYFSQTIAIFLEPFNLIKHTLPADLSQFVRIRRQAGYNYDRPSIAFDLPARQPSTVTQSSTSVSTQAQQMYYAYPAPNSGSAGSTVTTGGVVNIGFPSSGSTAGTTPGSTGYSYGTQGSTSAGPSSGTYSSSTGYSGSTGGTSQSSTPGVTGYGYNTPTQNPTSSTSGQNSVSTNAPTYLPPTVSSSAGVGSSSTSGINLSTSGASSATSLGVSDSYLPPLGSSVTTPSQVSTVSNFGGSDSPGYLPPKQSSTGIPQPSSPAGYLPPVGRPSTASSPSQGVISTPAPTYLPPLV